MNKLYEATLPDIRQNINQGGIPREENKQGEHYDHSRNHSFKRKARSHFPDSNTGRSS